MLATLGRTMLATLFLSSPIVILKSPRHTDRQTERERESEMYLDILASLPTLEGESSYFHEELLYREPMSPQ